MALTFNNILLPLPLEGIPRGAVRRAGELADCTGAKVHVIYIIEEEVFNEVSKQAHHVLTGPGRMRLFHDLREAHRKNAKEMILPEVTQILGVKPASFSVKEGAYHDIVLSSVDGLKADLVIMEYRAYSLINYRIMDRSPVPVWIERNEGKLKRIGLFCTNLAPNVRAPRAGVELAEMSGAELSPYFVQDPAGYIDVEEPDDVAKRFSLTWKKVEEGKFDDIIYKRSKKMDFDLIIIGRVKKRGYFHLRSKFAKKTRCSVLLVN